MSKMIHLNCKHRDTCKLKETCLVVTPMEDGADFGPSLNIRILNGRVQLHCFSYRRKEDEECTY